MRFMAVEGFNLVLQFGATRCSHSWLCNNIAKLSHSHMEHGNGNMDILNLLIKIHTFRVREALINADIEDFPCTW